MDDSDEDYHEDSDDGKSMSQRSPPKYKSIITIRAGKPKGDISEVLKDDPDKVRRLSLSEQQLVKVAATHAPDLIRYIFSHCV